MVGGWFGKLPGWLLCGPIGWLVVAWSGRFLGRLVCCLPSTDCLMLCSILGCFLGGPFGQLVTA